jgi:hypothetical protein
MLFLQDSHDSAQKLLVFPADGQHCSPYAFMQYIRALLKSICEHLVVD